MKNKIISIKTPLVIIGIVFLFYIIGGSFLKDHFNLLFRDWIFVLVVITLALCGLIIEIAILIKLNNILKKKVSIKEMWKKIIRTILGILIIFANFYVLLLCIFAIAVSFKEIEVEVHHGKKYVVRDTGWMTPDHVYDYHLYKNTFVYDAEIAHSGLVKWEDYSETQINDERQSTTTPGRTNENTNNTDKNKKMDIGDMEVVPSNVEYIQKIHDNLNYGFYLVDRAAHQYLYAFVESKNGGLSWKAISLFPATSEIYYGHFLDEQLGFVNFGSQSGLSLFMTSDRGLTWEEVLIDLSEENKGMLYVQSIENNGQKIELTLGYPSWVDSRQRIKYYSIDNGLSWHLQKE